MRSQSEILFTSHKMKKFMVLWKKLYIVFQFMRHIRTCNSDEGLECQNMAQHIPAKKKKKEKKKRKQFWYQNVPFVLSKKTHTTLYLSVKKEGIKWRSKLEMMWFLVRTKWMT